MDILIEVNGTLRVPDGTEPLDRFLEMLDGRGWCFGGLFRKGDPHRLAGTVCADHDLTLEEVRDHLTGWFAQQNWHFDGWFHTRINTDYLDLRRAKFDDWKPMYENVWRHESCARYMQWNVTPSEAEAKSRMERTIRYQENGGLSFIVCNNKGTPIGFCGIMETAPGVYEDTGGCLGPEFQRKGYGVQMLQALERLAFSRGAERFIVGHRRENLPSKKVITRCGFRYTHSEEKEDRILDFYEKRRSDMEVKLTYHGHACFTLEYMGTRAVIDPYEWGMIPGQPDLHLQAGAVYCSHEHADHNFIPAVELIGSPTLPWRVQTFTTPHDDCGGAKRGMNTVRIFDCGGIRVAHLGDIGCFPDDGLSAALKNVDCMLIPVGGYYTIGCQTAAQIVREANPKVAIPMHYRTDTTGFDEISHIDDFVKLWNEVNTCEETFVLKKDTEKQILIMN